MTSSGNPTVTFALIAYNQENYIREAISAAFSQTYEPLEIILSDDCSNDQTFEIMKRMAAAYDGKHKVRVRRNTSNLGLAKHINSVLASATGSIVSWAAGDDIALPNRTEVLVRELLLSSDTVATHSAVTEIDKWGNELGVRKHQLETQDITTLTVIQTGRAVVTQSMAFKKEIFDLFGPFRGDLTHEGKAMAFRLTISGRVKYVNQALTQYRVGTGVSTYSGTDIIRLKSTEPLKVTRWYLTSYQQMLEDISKLPSAVRDNYVDILNRKLCFFKNLEMINSGSSYIRPVMHNALLQPTSASSIRAALRSLIPQKLYRFFLYCYRGKKTN